MNNYTDFIEQVANGARFNIDFAGKLAKLNGKPYEVVETGVPQCTLREALRLIELYYANYKKSVPNERNDRRIKRYFKADSIDELSDEELCIGADRELAQAELEMLVLCLIINGSLYWDDDIMNGKWFWQSRKYPELVILKEWIV